MHHNRRRIAILIVLSLLGVAAFGFTYRVIARGAGDGRGISGGALAGY